MTKRFFVVVPYTPPVLRQEEGVNKAKKLFGFGGNKTTQKETEESDFEENRTQLQQRISVVEQGLTSTGVKMVRLGTEETIELLYKVFNPGDLQKAVQSSE